MNSIDTTEDIVDISQSPSEKIFSATFGISLWGGDCFLEIQCSFTITTVSGGG